LCSGSDPGPLSASDGGCATIPKSTVGPADPAPHEDASA